jgi:predicted membrane protein
MVGPGLFVGLWISTLGVIFLLDQMGIVPAHISFQFVWPAILIVAGLAIVFSTHSAGRFWGAILLAWGAISLSNELGFLHVRIGSLWPVFLIAAGLWMLFHSSGKFGHRPGWPGWQDWGEHMRQSVHEHVRQSVHEGPESVPPPFPGVQTGSTESDDSTFDQSVLLSGFKRRITSQHFKFAKISAVLGGFHLDLSRADIDGNQAVIHIDTVFGGGEIRVPDTWRIKIEATAVAGAFVDETYPRPDAPTPGKVLIVRGAAIFGGVSIKN